MLRKDLEMVLLAKERGQIGGQRIDEFLPLPLRPVVAFQPAQVLMKAVVPGIAQAARQAAVHHGVLAIVQADTGVLVDQRLHAGEIGIGPGELALRSPAPHGGRHAGCRPGIRGQRRSRSTHG